MAFLFAAVGLVFPGCDEEKKSVNLIENTFSLDDCTPVYKGNSSYLGESRTDLTLYATTEANQYYIPGFFGGEGGVAFYWDKETNVLSLIESYTGMYGDGGPVFILSENRYVSLAGEDAPGSFYSPVLNAFSFNVLFESADYYGNVVHMTSSLTFTVKEIL